MGVAYNNPPIVADGMVLCLDPGNLTSYSGTGTLIIDKSNKKNNGTLVGNPTYSNSYNGIISLSNNYTQWISIGSDPSYNSITNVTTEFWARPKRSYYYEYLCSNSRDCCGDYSGFNFNFAINPIDTNTAYIQFAIWNQAKSKYDSRGNLLSYGQTTVTSLTALPLNVWYHVCATYDGATMILYVNGVISNTLASTQGIGTPATFPMYVGRMGAGALSFYGDIGLGRIYNRALSQSEISQNFNATRRRFGI